MSQTERSTRRWSFGAGFPGPGEPSAHSQDDVHSTCGTHIFPEPLSSYPPRPRSCCSTAAIDALLGSMNASLLNAPLGVSTCSLNLLCGHNVLAQHPVRCPGHTTHYMIFGHAGFGFCVRRPPRVSIPQLLCDNVSPQVRCRRCRAAVKQSPICSCPGSCNRNRPTWSHGSGYQRMSTG